MHPCEQMPQGSCFGIGLKAHPPKPLYWLFIPALCMRAMYARIVLTILAFSPKKDMGGENGYIPMVDRGA
jgi:hypothetical protein